MAETDALCTTICLTAISGIVTGVNRARGWYVGIRNKQTQ